MAARFTFENSYLILDTCKNQSTMALHNPCSQMKSFGLVSAPEFRYTYLGRQGRSGDYSKELRLFNTYLSFIRVSFYIPCPKSITSAFLSFKAGTVQNLASL